MSLGDDAISALRHFERYKFRAGLAVLGIAASVASIVVLTAIADAMRRDKMRYFEESGARLSEVVLLNERGLLLEQEEPFEYTSYRFANRYDRITDYLPIRDWREIDKLRERCPGTIKAISPIIHNPEGHPKMSCDKMKGDIRAFGVTDDFFNCFLPTPLTGRVFTREELESGALVAVASHQLNHEYLAQMADGYDKLEAVYGKGYDPTALPMTLVEEDKTLRLKGAPYKVVGLLPPNRPVLEYFFRYNWCILVPFPQIRDLSDKAGTNRILFYPKGTPEEAFAEMKPILEEMYPGCTPILHSAQEWARQERKAMAAMTTGFLAIGLATLLVAAVNVMNTMLVSVRERKLEIGIRKAAGATARDIRNQFAGETLILTGVGIVLGLLLAIVLALAVEHTQHTVLIPLLKKLREYWGIYSAGGKSMEPREWDIRFAVLAAASAVAVMVALSVAMLASLLPAREAARMHPVVCLTRRWEVPRAVRGANLGWFAFLRPLLADPERTWLAVSSLSVGVALIVVLTGIGEHNRLQTMGWEKWVPPNAIHFHLWGGQIMWFHIYPEFDHDFVAQVEEQCPHVDEVSYSVWMSRDLGPKGGVAMRSPHAVVDRETSNRLRVWGADAVNARHLDFFPNMRLKAGETLSQEDIDERVPVCLLDEHAADVFYPEGDALGQEVEIQGIRFTVKGVIEDVNPYADEVWGGAYIPMSFSRTVLENDTACSLFATTTEPHLARDEIARLYEDRYGLEIDRSRQFTMIGEAQAQARKEAWLHSAQIILLALGAMFVGGVGMANIMLISTTARTREIGILRAMGASRMHIAGQFLGESLLLSSASALAGILVGSVFTEYGLPLLCAVWRQEEAWPTVLTVHWVAAALVFGVLVGLGSSLAPAIKAGMVLPADALRTE